MHRQCRSTRARHGSPLDDEQRRDHEQSPHAGSRRHSQASARSRRAAGRRWPRAPRTATPASDLADRRRRGRRRRLDADALDPRAPREAGQPARRRVQRATRTRSSSPSCRTTTTSPRSAPQPARTACPTCSPPTSSTCRTGSSRGCSRTSRANIDGLDFKDEINQGHLVGGHRSTARSTCCRSCSTSRCCSGTRTSSPRPASTRRRRPANLAEFAAGRQGHPGAEQARHLRHRDRPELRRMPRLHLVPERLGRRRGGA